MRRNNPLSRIASAIAIVALALTACVKYQPAHSEWQTISAGGWPYGDTLRFNADRADSAAVGGVALAVRHTDSYAYSNLWLEVAYTHADSTVADTFNLVLADEFGRWHGKGSGVTFQFTDTVALSRRPDTASVIVVRHIMRVDTLHGIEQVGIAY